MRRLAALLIVLILMGGCASASRPATAGAADAPPRRCSPADPDRWAWFCVVGQILYGAAAFFQPVNELSAR